MLNYFPKYFTSKAIYLYFIALLGCSVVFFAHILPFMWIFFGVLAAVGFFYFSNKLSKQWANYSSKIFVKRLFYTALTIRVIYVTFSYFFYYRLNGTHFETGAADALFYNDIGSFGSTLIANGNFNFYTEFQRYTGNIALSDMGYPVWLSFVYFFSGNSIFIARLFKALFGALTCIYLYKLSARSFGESTGRMAAIFCMLMPNLIYYCGLHLKEVEMVFLTVLFLERTDFLLRSNKFIFINIFIPFFIAVILFTFRTALGATALFALFSAVTLSTDRILGFGKKIIITFWAIGAVAFFIGGNISNEVEQLWQNRTENQKTSMEWRTEREGGNKYAKYASTTVFAPMVFIIPIPTMVNIPEQQNQMMIHGGNYVKEVLAFFVLFILFWIIKEKKWRDFLLIETFTLGYLGVIALSAFAQSERFHQPALPLILALAALGVSKITNKQKKYFQWYLAFLFVIILAWNWFKLSGKGMI